jgi:hypothetical protein
MRKLYTIILGIIITAFAFLTLFLSSSVIFDWFDIRVKEGNYVLFVVWANFICSLLYLAAAYSLFNRKKWSYKILGLAVIVLLVALSGLIIHIYQGGLYETKTIGAICFRIGLTTVFTSFSYLLLKKGK